MKNVAWLLTVLLLMIGVARGQGGEAYHKLGASLKIWLANQQSLNRGGAADGQKMLPVMVQLGSEQDAKVIVRYGGVVHTVAGNIVTTDIPAANLLTFAESPAVRRIELPLALHPTDNKMKQMVHATDVHNGTGPLPRGYTGKNVLVGIIDDGIDFSHPDFYDSAGRCRISTVWNMDYGGHPPAGYTYGTEWTRDSLERYGHLFSRDRAIGKYDMQKKFGYSFHGTSVAGLAAGNNGMAPSADIAVVALTAFADTILNSNRLIDGINYLLQKAKAENKKCVVNISLGVSDGAPHDGKSLIEQAIDNLSYKNPGLLICTSAGNNGNNWKHWGGFPIHKDSSFSFFYSSGLASLYFTIPRKYRDSLSISIGESNLGSLNNPNISRDSVFFQTPFYSIAQLQQATAPVTVQSTDATNITRSRLQFASSPYNDEYDEMVVTVDAYQRYNNNTFDPHLYRFIIKGKGTLHAWYPFLNLHPMFLFDRNPLPNDPTFHLSDNNLTTVIPSNAFSVISAGAYNIRTCYVNIRDKIISQYNVCRPAYFTSRGPTLDGRIKPDIMAPGDNVMSARSRFDDFLGHDFIVDTNTVSFGGTSASSPIVAGAAALLWERFPDISGDSIKTLLMRNTVNDFYTEEFGPSPNNLTGYGKLDVFKAMTGTTLPPIDCNAKDTCVSTYTPPPPPMPGGTITTESFALYPNPAGSVVQLKYVSQTSFAVTIFESKGRNMRTIIKGPSGVGGGIMSLPVAALAGGIYFVRITDIDGTVKKVIPLLVAH